MVTSRPYAGGADLRRMQDAVAVALACTSLRVGDVAWLARFGTHRELSLRIRLWEDVSGGLVAWTYLRSNGEFNLFVARGRAADGLLEEMLGAVEAEAAASVSAGDPPVALYTYGVDASRSDEDRAIRAALERHGFDRTSSVGGLLRRDLDDFPAPSIPNGHRLAAVESDEDIAGR